MEKLELRHLAPYLPYGVKVEIKGGFIFPWQRTLGKHSHTSSGFRYKDKDVIELDSRILSEWLDIESNQFKPILRPLSDITKEIEVNGERFVPEQKLEEVDGEYSIYYDDGDIIFNDKCILNLYEVTRCNRLILKLCEWHFDIFGLIGDGLAIDINTLETSSLCQCNEEKDWNERRLNECCDCFKPLYKTQK